MPQPTPYDRITNFQNDQALHPTDPYPAPLVDAEYNAIKITLDEILQNLLLIQRDDGQLANDSVGFDQLRDEVLIGFNAPSPWVTNHDYIQGDTVFQDSAFWYCTTAHESTVFADDYAAGYWSLIADFSTVVTTGAPMFVSDGPPALPHQGVQWYESDTGNTYLYYIEPGETVGQWVQINGVPDAAPPDASLYLMKAGGTMTGGPLASAPSSGTIAAASNATQTFEVRSAAADAAFMSFHRVGSYASHIGIDTDNQWKVGGWSAGANAYRLWHEGNSHPQADLRDWAGLDLTDTNDNATLFQTALNQTAAVGAILNLPAGKIRIGSPITWPGASHIRGQGQAPANSSVPTSYTTKYTWLHFAHTGIGMLAQGEGAARSMRGVNFYRDQPAPGPGWAPTVNDYDIRILGTSGVTMDDCMFLNTAQMIHVTGDSVAGYGCGQLVFRNIKGCPLRMGFFVEQVYDCIYLDEIHLWPFWTGSADVANNVRNNAYAFVFKRVDNPKIGRIFAYGYYRGFSFFYSEPVGPPTLPGGSTSLFHADVMGMDNCGRALLINTDADGTTAHVNDFYGGSASPGTEPVVSILADSCNLSLGRLYGYSASKLVEVSGVNNLVTIGASRSAAISDTEFSVAANNTLRLGFVPNTTAPTKYVSGGIIETPEWRSYVPGVSSSVGAIGAYTIVAAKFRRVDKTIDMSVRLQITTNGTADQYIQIQLPYVAGTGGWLLTGRNLNTGATLQGFIITGSGTVTVATASNGYAGGTGHDLFVSGTYEAA